MEIDDSMMKKTFNRIGCRCNSEEDEVSSEVGHLWSARELFDNMPKRR